MKARNYGFKYQALLMLICFLGISDINAQLNFSTATNFGAGVNPNAICAADFNLDGNPDLAISNVNGSNISVLLKSNTNTFSNAVNYTTGGAPSGIASADFNGDGKPDLVTANVVSTNKNVSVFMGTGTGTFATARNYNVGTSTCRSVTTGDFNKDSIIDLAVATNTSGGLVYILLGTDSSIFATPQSYPAGVNPYFIITADLNNDKILDLATANYNSSNVTVLLGVGNGTFTYLSNYSVGSSPLSIAVGDYNGDGKNDLAVANSGGSTVSVLLGNGTGALATAVNYTVSNVPTEVISADFDDDGKLDLATCNSTSGNVSILLGKGDGSFATATNFGVGSSPQALIATDFNGDKKLDIATCNFAGNNASVILNTSTPLGLLDFLQNDNSLFEVYPNPSNNLIHLNLHDNQLSQTKISLFNMYGELVWSKDADESLISLEIAPYTSGVYYLHVASNGNSKIAKIVKQ